VCLRDQQVSKLPKNCSNRGKKVFREPCLYVLVLRFIYICNFPMHCCIAFSQYITLLWPLNAPCFKIHARCVFKINKLVNFPITIQTEEKGTISYVLVLRLIYICNFPICFCIAVLQSITLLWPLNAPCFKIHGRCVFQIVSKLPENYSDRGKKFFLGTISLCISFKTHLHLRFSDAFLHCGFTIYYLVLTPKCTLFQNAGKMRLQDQQASKLPNNHSDIGKKRFYKNHFFM